MAAAARPEPAFLVTEKNWNGLLKSLEGILEMQAAFSAEMRTLASREELEKTLDRQRTIMQVHLDDMKECPDCGRILATLRGEIELEKADPADDLKPLADIQQRIVKEKQRCGRRNALIAALVVLCLIPLFWLSWNQFRQSGICFTNIYEYRIGNEFMKLLADGSYEEAYEYIDIEEIREQWRQTWFDEEKLVDLKSDGKAMFCAYGQKLEEAGGIDDYEYVGISKCMIDEQGGVWYRLVFNIHIGNRTETFHVDASQGGVYTFGGLGSYDDPLTQFSMWSEYLWQDYEGCYFDTNLNQYIYDTEEP